MRALPGPGDLLVTVPVLALGVVLALAAARSFAFAWWKALGLVFGAAIAVLVVFMRLQASFVGRPSRHWVNSIRSNRVEVMEGEWGPDRGRLRALGGRRGFMTPWVWTFEVEDDRGLAPLLAALRDLGIVFLGVDKGWSPGDIFEDLRERGLVKGPFEEIVWSGPGRSEVRKR